MGMDFNNVGATTSYITQLGGLAPGATAQLTNPTANPLANVAGSGIIGETLRGLKDGSLMAAKPPGPEEQKKLAKEKRKDDLQERIAAALEKIAARSESSGTTGNDADTAALAAYSSLDLDA